MKFAVLAGAAAFAAACTNTGNVERNALGGAAIGGVAGAVIGNNVGEGDAAEGAAIGAAVGAAAGAFRGCRQDGNCGAQRSGSEGPYYLDPEANRYYYVDPNTGNTYWRDGSPRSTAR